MRGIFLIRHGNTTWDTRVDALLDPPLDREGVNRIKRTVEFMKGQEFVRIISSPLQRAMKVASMLSQGNHKVTPSNGALPWNLGDLMGKQSAMVKQQLENLKNYPDLKPPHGESYRSFYLRWTEFLEKLMAYIDAKPEGLVIVTHSRNINALQSFIGGNPIGDVTESAQEGSVTLLAKNGVNNWTSKQIWDGR